MSPLFFLMSLYYLQALTYCKFASSARLNSIYDHNEIFDSPILSNSDEIEKDAETLNVGHGQTEVEFRYPINAVDIDYSKNAIIFKFRKQHLRPAPSDSDKTERRLFAEDFMRFGKRALDYAPIDNSIQRSDESQSEKGERFERSTEGFHKTGNLGVRDSRGDNFMRFGRDITTHLGHSTADYMRFGRNPGDFMRFGRSPADFMRFGRTPGDFMRFGRNPGQDFMRFGRNPADFMRFGRTPEDFMRLGRIPAQDFMRFGRSGQKNIHSLDKNLVRFVRDSDKSSNFMRFGRSSQTFTNALGQSEEKDLNRTSSAPFQKNEVKAVAKIIHDLEPNRDNGNNPMDKAIQVLFNKHATGYDIADLNKENEDPEQDY